MRDTLYTLYTQTVLVLLQITLIGPQLNKANQMIRMAKENYFKMLYV